MEEASGPFPRLRPVLAALLTTAAALAGCAESTDLPEDPSAAPPPATAGPAGTPSAAAATSEPANERAANPAAAGLPQSASTPGYHLLLAATDIAAGRTRFPFVVIGPEGAFVEDTDFAVSFFPVDEDTGEAGPAQEHGATYRVLETELPHIHDDGSTHIHQDSQGIYVVDAVDFSSAGIWGVRATGEAIDLAIAVRVAERTLTPAIGDPAPRTAQAVARDVESLSEISTAEPPAPALYEMTIAEALDRGRPLVVVFSTPAYCQSRVCGPVLDEVTEVMPEFHGRVEFVHIEPFDLETIRGGGGFTLVPAATQWGLPSEPWVFVVGADGRIAAKFEGIVTASELRDAVEAVVEG